MFFINIGVFFIRSTKINNKKADRAPARARPAGVRPVRARAGAQSFFYKFKEKIEILFKSVCFKLSEQQKHPPARQPVHARDGRRRGVHGRARGRIYCCLFH